MTAALDRSQSDSTAAGATIAALRDDVFVALTAKLGATNNIARAQLFGVDRSVIQRMRRRKFAPRLSLALRMAERLGTTVNELFELEQVT